MRDYAELIEALRCCSGRACCNACPYENDDEKCDSVQGRAADAIEELLTATPKWISVDERLPEVANKVLTYNGDYVSENWRCTIVDKDGRREIWAYSEKFVSHWLPLPEPPKENKT